LNEELEAAKLRAKLKKSQEERNVKVNQIAKPQRESYERKQSSFFSDDEEEIDYAALRRPPNRVTKILNSLFFGGLLAYIIVYIMYKKKIKHPDNSKYFNNL